MTPTQLGGRRQPSLVRVAVVAAIALLFGAGLLASSLLDARAAPAAQVTLQLWPSGQGRIDVTQGGQGLDPNPCDFTAVIARGAAAPCLVTVTVGTPVTLTATPEPNATVPPDRVDEVPDFPVAQPAFVRWSRSDCGTATTCTFTPDADSDGDWVTALFTPLELQVGVFGAGTVTFHRSDGVVVQPACPSAVGFGDRTCHAAVPADLDVVINASPNPTGWGIGCEHASPTSPTCTLGMSNLRTLAFVSFDGQPPLDPPFRLTPTVKVKLGGTGQGRVTGSVPGGDQIDCPGTCQASADYQARIQLQAQASAGSTFVRWVGVCSTAATCTFNAGSATQVQALFETASTTTTTTTTTATTTTARTTTATTTARTTTATTTTKRQKIRLTRISVSGHGSARVIRLGVVVDRRSRGTARLTKGRTTIVFPSVVLRAGPNAVRLRVPRRTKPATYRLSIRIGTGSGSQTLRASVRIPR